MSYGYETDYTNRKAVEAVEVKKELKVPPLHPHYGRKTRPETLERARLLLNLTLHQAVIISSALPQWNNILKRVRESRIKNVSELYAYRFRTFYIEESKQLIVVRVK